MKKQRIIREKAKEELNKRKTVKMGYNKIIADGVEWRWDPNIEILRKTENQAIKEANIIVGTTKQTGNTQKNGSAQR